MTKHCILLSVISKLHSRVSEIFYSKLSKTKVKVHPSVLQFGPKYRCNTKPCTVETNVSDIGQQGEMSLFLPFKKKKLYEKEKLI